MMRRTVASVPSVIAGLLFSQASTSPAQTPKWDSCRPAPEVDAAKMLRDAHQAIGAGNPKLSVLHLRMTDAMLQDYQSDRSYPPFFYGFASRESWYHPDNGVLRSRGRMTFPNGEFDLGEILNTSTATFSAGDTVRPAPAQHGGALSVRDLDPWPVLYDWSESERVTVVGSCRVRDYPRMGVLLW